jgi:hypothetical protein
MKRGWALAGIILGGLVLGLGLGVLYAWVIRPVTYVDTAPVALRGDFKDQFRAMIALAYASNGNLPRAQARLVLLGDGAPAAALMDQSRREAGLGGSAEAALDLANLAQALAPGETLIAASLTPAPSATATHVAPTTTRVAPTITARPRSSPSRTAATHIPATATRTPRPTLTPHPSATPTVTPGQPFALVTHDVVCDQDLQPGLLQVVVKDGDGKAVAGAEIIISWEGGQESFFTGLQPELGDGYADYVMADGVTYSLHLAVDSETASNLSIPACQASDGSSYDGGLSLVFQQP